MTDGSSFNAGSSAPGPDAGSSAPTPDTGAFAPGFDPALAPEAPRFDFGTAPGAPLAPPRRGLSPWIALAIAGVLAVPLLVGTGAMAVFAQDEAGAIFAEDEAFPEFEDEPGTGIFEDWAEGTVTDDTGAVREGAGSIEDPAIIGRDTLSWPLPEGGTVDIKVRSIDWDATDEVAAADPMNPPADTGTVYVQLTMDATVHGEGIFDPYEQLYVSAELPDDGYVTDADVRAITANPAYTVGGLGDGRMGTFQVLLMIPEDQIDQAILMVETDDGEPLVIAEG